MTETNREQTLADIEQVYEDAKTALRVAKDRLEANRGHYHTQLVARREAGENLTVSDIRALEKTAIDDIPSVRSAYLDFIDKQTAFGISRVTKDSATRSYWDNKELHRGLLR